ncbi:MAG: hypothetical protein ABIL25_00515 [candidate division WOR-3 bacterium]
MARRNSCSDPEQERGERIIEQMRRLERVGQAYPRSWGLLLITVFLLLAIVVVILVNRERFALLWTRLTRPDSIPGISP